MNLVVDTGTSYHASSQMDFFTSYKSNNFGVVKMGNDETSKIMKICVIAMKTNLGCRLVLKDVRHVRDLHLNLISTRRINEEIYISTFGKRQWKLTKESLIVARSKKYCTLYKIQAKMNGEVNTTKQDPFMEPWHKRMGHISEKVL